MSGVRGGDKAPGEFRRTQNWLGGTRPGNARFVPPPAPEVATAMSALEKFLRAAASGLRVHELAGERVVLAAGDTARRLGLSVPTVNAAFERLERAGILREVTGRRRGRLFVYDAYLELLQAET